MKNPIRYWHIVVFLCVGAYLLLNAATNTLRVYHWFTLLLVPAAMCSGERGRRFFLDWLPLFVFWISYDRLRLVQPLLLGRVAVKWPYDFERRLFGWMSPGSVPPHAAREWMRAHSGSIWADALFDLAQFVYLSQIFAVPALMLLWWWLGNRRRQNQHHVIDGRKSPPEPGFDSGSAQPSEWYRHWFGRCLYAFTWLNAIGLAGYLLLPVAPPWWVTLHGMSQPTQSLIATSRLSLAMDGRIVQGMIQTAPYWFGAVPSLHSAYPVLLALLGVNHLSRPALIATVAYAVLMSVACVILNQHYVFDLLAGELAAIVAWQLGTKSITKLSTNLRK
ncbi:MAG TPA: phosphatase PAP2 family protein [Acidobacteriota bacterium]